MLLARPLSAGQIALWHGLMNIDNRCAWAEWFCAANITLELSCGLSRRGILDARNALKQAGLIDFKTRGTRATMYRMARLYAVQNTSATAYTAQDTAIGTAIDTAIDTAQDTATLNKPKTSKPKHKDKEHLPFGAKNLPDNLKEALAKWRGYKSEKNQPYKPTGWESLVKKAQSEAAKHSAADVAELINTCMANNWQGIIWDKLGKTAPAKISGLANPFLREDL